MLPGIATAKSLPRSIKSPDGLAVGASADHGVTHVHHPTEMYREEYKPIPADEAFLVDGRLLMGDPVIVVSLNGEKQL